MALYYHYAFKFAPPVGEKTHKKKSFYHMSLVTWENRSSGFPTRSDTNRAVQSQKMAIGLKFRI